MLSSWVLTGFLSAKHGHFLSKMDHNSHDYLSHETNSPINARYGRPLLRFATQEQQSIFLASKI